MICRVASTPPIPGMFRSITTTSGTVSRISVERLGARLGLAADVDALPLEQRAQAGAEEVVVVDQEDPRREERCARRALLSLSSLALDAVRGRAGVGRAGGAAAGSLVEGDRDRPAAPGLRHARAVGNQRSMIAPLIGAARVGRDGLAVAGDGHVRPERDHARVDGDDAPADGQPARRVAGQRVGDRRDRRASGRAPIETVAARASQRVVGARAVELLRSATPAACAWDSICAICSAFSSRRCRRSAMYALALGPRRRERARRRGLRPRRGGEPGGARGRARATCGRSAPSRRAAASSTSWLVEVTRSRLSSPSSASSSDVAPRMISSVLVSPWSKSSRIRDASRCCETRAPLDRHLHLGRERRPARGAAGRPAARAARAACARARGCESSA